MDHYRLSINSSWHEFCLDIFSLTLGSAHGLVDHRLGGKTLVAGCASSRYHGTPETTIWVQHSAVWQGNSWILQTTVDLKNCNFKCEGYHIANSKYMHYSGQMVHNFCILWFSQYGYIWIIYGTLITFCVVSGSHLCSQSSLTLFPCSQQEGCHRCR